MTAARLRSGGWTFLAIAACLAACPTGRAEEPSDRGNESNEPASGFSLTQVERIGSTRFRHGLTISQLWFPAHDRLVSGGSLRFRLFDAVSGELKNEVACPLHSRSSFDGQRRVLVAEPLVNGVPTQDFRVEDLVSGQQVAKWRHPEWTQSSAISRRGKIAALANGRHTVSVVDVQTGREIDRFKQLLPRSNRAAYPHVSLSPDDRILAVLPRPDAAQFVELTVNGNIQRTLATIDDQEFRHLVFSSAPDEVLLIGDRSSSLWNVRTQKQIARWDEPDVNAVSDAVFARQGKVVAELTELPNIVRVRDTRTGKEQRNFRLNANPESYRLALSPDEAVLAAGGYQGRIRLYDFATGKEIRFDADRETHATVESVAISDDGNWIASAEYLGAVSLWSRSDKNEWKRTVVPDDVASEFKFGTNAGPNFLTFLPGTAKLFSGCGIRHHSLNVWDAPAATRDDRFTGHGIAVSGVATSRDGQLLASCSRNGMLGIWNRSGEQLHSIKAAGWSLALSPDGSVVAVCGSRAGPIRGHGGIPEPSFAIPAVELWSTRTGKLMRSLDLTGVNIGSPGYGFYSVSFSHDGRLVAGIAKEGLFVWDAMTGKQKRLIPLPHPAVDEHTLSHAPNCGCAFSPAENIIAVPTAAGSILFFDVEAATDKPLAEVKGHNDPVNSVAWRRDGQYVVSGGNDSTIVLWRVNR